MVNYNNNTVKNFYVANGNESEAKQSKTVALQNDNDVNSGNLVASSMQQHVITKITMLTTTATICNARNFKSTQNNKSPPEWLCSDAQRNSLNVHCSVVTRSVEGKAFRIDAQCSGFVATKISMYVYIYTYMFVCVCVRV